MSIKASGYHGECDHCGKRVVENALTLDFAREMLKKFGFTRPVIGGAVLDLCGDCDRRAQIRNQGPLSYESLPGAGSNE